MMGGPSTRPHVRPGMTSSSRLRGLTLMTSLTSTKVLLRHSCPLSEDSTGWVRQRDISDLVPKAPSVQKRAGPGWVSRAELDLDVSAGPLALAPGLWLEPPLLSDCCGGTWNHLISCCLKVITEP